MCRIDYAEDYGFWFQDPHLVIGKKEHRCDDCGRTIYKGEGYTYGVWYGEDGVMTVKACEHCVAAGRWLRKVCGGHLWPGVLEELREHWDEEYELRSHGLGRLLLWGERKWERDGRMLTVAEVDVYVDAALTRVPADALH